MNLKKLSIVSFAIMMVPLYEKAAFADKLTIDLKSHEITYEDAKLNILKTFPIVGPRPETIHHYNGRSSFDVDAIAYKPSWKDSLGRSVPYGQNPLGIGLIRFKDRSEGPGRPCSIHGNAKVEDLGQNLSGCCIRMLDEDFLEIFFDVGYSTDVIIQY